MNKRSLTIVVLVILAVIISVILFDFISKRPDRRGANPYALDVDQYKEVDEALVSHKETRNFSLGLLAASAIYLHNDSLFIVGESSMAIITTGGTSLGLYEILPHPTSLVVEDNYLYIGYQKYVAKYDHSGALVDRWTELDERAVITSLAIKDDRIYVADAGNRKVLIYNNSGEIVGEFEGTAESDLGHGFIVPSANFDLVVNSYGELWVVNPGKHALENYTDEGQMRGFWENSSVEIEGFLGCCNPARITAMEDGSFVTSEKGLVRIKIYDQSGALKSVVATPALFKEEGKAPDICVDSQGIVYALDFDKDMVRIFEPKGNG
jgi:hypothetical protein